ncbi:MAG TPA: dihydroorotase [Terriglobales bacterium]|nr:dihydroorotase [Terriglobales bacterium]
MKPILIRGGRVIDPANQIDTAMDLLLENGRVKQVAQPGSIKPTGRKVVDAAGMIVAPGLVDIHVHLRQPGQEHKETIATGTAAAAAGGFTSVCCMPNTIPVNDSPEITRWMLAKERGAIVNVFPIGAATVGSNGEQLTDFAKLKGAGTVAVTDDGKPILNDDIMEKALRSAAKLGLPVIQHAEDTRLTGECSMNLGATSFRLGLRGMPAEAESGIVERDIALARKTGGHLHVAHISTRKALSAVRRAKKDGVNVTSEVTPHHFTLLDKHVGGYNTNFKMNPPLRCEDDRAAMIRGLLDGTIDAIATDHAPHALHEKQQEFDRAPMGITGLETALPIALQVLHRHHKMSLSRVIQLLSANPARLMGLERRGTLSPGAYADVAIIDPGQPWTFYAQQSKSKSKNTPFDGWEFVGAAVMTIVAGEIVFMAKNAKPKAAR